MFLGKSGKTRAVMGKQRLIGGDNMLAGFECGLDGLLGDALLAADQLDEDVDLRILRQGDRIGDKANAGYIGVTALLMVARGDRNNFQIPPGTRGKLVPASGQEAQSPASDRPKPG